MSNPYYVGKNELFELFKIKYGDPERTGWSPKQRLKFGYFQPADNYEALINKLVSTSTDWVDVGGGSAVFPHNEKLSTMLSERCNILYAVDPSDNVYDNPYAHKKIQGMFEDLDTEQKFDLATFRMVAEHIANPAAVIEKLRTVMKPGGLVVIYTINKYSPVPIITYITPFHLHHKIKKFFWGGEEKDTFPVEYKMNTRKDLLKIFKNGEFSEEHFKYLDDLSTFSRFKWLNYIDLCFWKLLNIFSIRYPENNLLGIYKM